MNREERRALMKGTGCKLTKPSLAQMWLLHFGERKPREVTCEDCCHFMAETCGGGEDPMECMASNKHGCIIVNIG